MKGSPCEIMRDIKIQIVNLDPKYAKALENLQIKCFPTLARSELLTEDMFLKHCELFPEGQFVALYEETVVGLGAGFFMDFDFEDREHTFNDVIGGGYYTNHDPNGIWYYGADISVDPDFRGYGIGRLLYRSRKDIVKRYNKMGIVAGGVLPGFAKHKHEMSAEDYVAKVVAGELFDRTLSFQLRNGFKVAGVLQNYILDKAADNWAALIVWRNPDFNPGL